ncbi:MAG: NADH-quinone oxidoreductase subunit N [Phycisphaeraceae bacterium]|nr:NADH-quinone oxidoreductase subunit N [Phycisphaeraceae bacterium]
MSMMGQKVMLLGPEITLAVGACLCLGVGLSRSLAARRLTPWLAALSIVTAGLFVRPGAPGGYVPAYLGVYVKFAVLAMGLLLLLLAAGLPRGWSQTDDEADGRTYNPGLSMRGEFFAFGLLSLAGTMLVAGAGDLVWLFLALELASLPTYVMIAISRPSSAALEASVKYFALSALSAAVFLLGFTLIYGVTGQTEFAAIARTIGGMGSLPLLLVLGLVLSVVGIGYKIAAAPMHFYAADVYQGAASPVTAFLAIVPKTAGFVALLLLLPLSEPMPASVRWLIWGMSAASMTVGNVLGLLQTSVKRMLAYSSIAHSGYMLMGLLVSRSSEPSAAGTSALGSGAGAVLFYLVAYGLATVGAFAVVGLLERQGQEADRYEDFAGLARTRPMLAGVLLVSLLSLIGLPPMAGIIGKIYLFGSLLTDASGHGEYLVLIVAAVINSAVSAVYYLRLAGVCFFQSPAEGVRTPHDAPKWAGGAAAAVLTLLLGFALPTHLVRASKFAAMRDTTPRAGFIFDNRISAIVPVDEQGRPRYTPEQQRMLDDIEYFQHYHPDEAWYEDWRRDMPDPGPGVEAWKRGSTTEPGR